MSTIVLPKGLTREDFDQATTLYDAFKASIGKPKFWICQRVLITVEDARDILAERRMSTERKPMKYTWGKYSTSMKRGEFWGLLHTVKFGQPTYGDEKVADGVEPLFDAQHRLLGIINSGMPQLMNVMFNVPKEAHPHIDTPRVRPQYSALAFAGKDDAKLMHRLATRAVLLSQGYRTFNGHAKPTYEQTLEVIERGGVTEATAWAKKFRGTHLANDTAVGTCVYAILTESKADSLGDRVDEFFHTLLIGAGDNWNRDNMIWVLRDRLIRDWGLKGQLVDTTGIQSKFILDTWNHVIKGTFASFLRKPEGGDPLVIPA